MSYHVSHDPALLESILSSLGKAGLYERAGELHEYLGRSQVRRPAFSGWPREHFSRSTRGPPAALRVRLAPCVPQEALAAYRRGHAYRKAIDLARREFPASVIEIEEEWGDWLMGQKAMDAAINHFIGERSARDAVPPSSAVRSRAERCVDRRVDRVAEAGRSLKAIEAAIQCRQFSKAAGIIDYLDHSQVRGLACGTVCASCPTSWRAHRAPPFPAVRTQALPYYKRIASHYESTGNLDEVRAPNRRPSVVPHLWSTASYEQHFLARPCAPSLTLSCCVPVHLPCRPSATTSRPAWPWTPWTCTAAPAAGRPPKRWRAATSATGRCATSTGAWLAHGGHANRPTRSHTCQALHRHQQVCERACCPRRKKAREFEASFKYKEAERAYLQGDEVDMAITMYKKARNYDQMIRLVSQHRKDNLVQVCVCVVCVRLPVGACGVWGAWGRARSCTWRASACERCWREGCCTLFVWRRACRAIAAGCRAPGGPSRLAMLSVLCCCVPRVPAGAPAGGQGARGRRQPARGGEALRGRQGLEGRRANVPRQRLVGGRAARRKGARPSLPLPPQKSSPCAWGHGDSAALRQAAGDDIACTDVCVRRVQVCGGPNAARQVAYAWAITLGGEEGATLLRKMGMLDAAIDYATESGAFQQVRRPSGPVT